MLTPRRAFPAVATSDGSIFAISGVYRNQSMVTSACEVYQPLTNIWRSIATTPALTLWGAPAVSLANGHVLVIGGFRNGPLATVFEYAPELNTWSMAPSMPMALYHAAATRGADGRVYVFGGNASRETTAAFVFNPAQQRWDTLRSLPRPRGNSPAAIATPDGRIHIVGGSVFSPAREYLPVTQVDIYVPGSDSYVEGPVLPAMRPFAGIALGTDERVYVAGGMVGSEEATSDVFAYSLVSGSVTSLASLPFRLREHTLVGMPNGLIVALGGRSPERVGPDGGVQLNTVLTYSAAEDRWTQ